MTPKHYTACTHPGRHRFHILGMTTGCLIVLALCITSSFTTFGPNVYTELSVERSVLGQESNNIVDRLGLESGDFLTYECKIVLLRFTNGSVLYCGSNIGQVYLNISFEEVRSNELLVLLHYYGTLLDANSGKVHAMDTSFELEYSLSNGNAIILDGSLVGTEGKFSLFEQDDWVMNDNFTIATNVNSTICARYVVHSNDVAINVMGGVQIVNDYNCTFFDPFENETRSHVRSYDSDKGVLLEAPFGFADPILLGGIDILRISGKLSLIDTSIHLGPPVTGIAITPQLLLAVGGLVVFALSYFVVYRAQTGKKRERKKKGTVSYTHLTLPTKA